MLIVANSSKKILMQNIFLTVQVGTNPKGFDLLWIVEYICCRKLFIQAWSITIFWSLEIEKICWWTFNFIQYAMKSMEILLEVVILLEKKVVGWFKKIPIQCNLEDLEQLDLGIGFRMVLEGGWRGRNQRSNMRAENWFFGNWLILIWNEKFQSQN